jgi:exopolyphosphatase/pppGpp-phosphohydrolase
MKNSSKTVFLFFFFNLCLLLLTLQGYAQNLYGGIEIGSKGVKMSVIDVENAKKSIYTIKEFWTENAGVAKGISVDGKLAEDDMDNASSIVALNYDKLLKTHKIPNDKIFIVASSGVGLASNANELVQKVKNYTGKDMEVISSKLESKLMYRGCVPPKMYGNSLLVDIGGGNTKGGYAEVINDNMVFFPLNLDLGTITLTEKINKEVGNTSLDKFLAANFKFQTILSGKLEEMFKERPLTKKKLNVYLSGGAVWAFYTLFYGKPADNYSEITLEDVQEYNAMVQNNFAKFTDMATTNKEAERVLKTYSQKHLIAANSILMHALEDLGELKTKKLYFAKNGQIAWLLSYIADSAKGAKVMY